MIAIELVQPGTKNANAAAAKSVVSYCNQHGVIRARLRHVRQTSSDYCRHW